MSTCARLSSLTRLKRVQISTIRLPGVPFFKVKTGLIEARDERVEERR